VLGIVAGHVVVMTVLAVIVCNFVFGAPLFRASAQVNCAAGDGAYTVASGDTLGRIAERNQTTWQALAQHNKLANANMLSIGQVICIPGGTSASQGKQQSESAQGSRQSLAIKGSGNYFPYGQCTWWANERYHQLHGVYVPWTTNSNALQWTARAQDFHWQVSSMPSVGAIIDLQAGVQGASDLGHVAIVEDVLADGRVAASNMNWGGRSSVVEINFVPGDGVTFIKM
jgi:surface antigen